MIILLKKQENYSIKSFFYKKFKSTGAHAMYRGHHIRNKTRKQMLGRKLLHHFESIVRQVRINVNILNRQKNSPKGH